MLFFLFLVAFNNFFTSPVHNENARLKLALVIPIGAPIAIAKDAIEIPPLVTDKTIKDYQNNQKKKYIYRVFYSLILFL